MEEVLIQLLQGNRHQRHDFLNHLQVIWGYLKLNKSEDAAQYIQEVVKYLQSLHCLNNIASPELAADITAKVLGLGLQKGFTINIPEKWEIPEGNITQVRKLLREIWELIKLQIFAEDIKIDLSLIKQKIIINVHTNDENKIFQWEKIKNLAYQCGFKCEVVGEKITITISNDL